MTVRRASMGLSIWILLSVAALFAVGCTSGASSTTSATTSTTMTPVQRAAEPIAVDPTTAQGTGTPLGNGFTVADGSVLLTGPLPAAPTFFSPTGEPVPVEGWAAHLEVGS